jgi:1,3-beta-glucan synthase
MYQAVLPPWTTARQVLVKTFCERRSWAAVFRAFYRLYSLQLVLLSLILAYAFAPRDLMVLSSAVLTHAWLAALERTANWWMTRRWEVLDA